MKCILVSLFITVTILGCSKKNETPPTKTYVTINNNTANNLNNVKVGYMNWAAGTADLIQTIGSMNSGSSSTQIEITNSYLQEVYVYFDYSSTTYMVADGYKLNQGQPETLIIDGTTKSVVVKKTNNLYPK